MDRRRIRQTAIHLALGLALLVSGYGAGRVQGGWSAGALRDAHQQELDELHQEQAALQQECEQRQDELQAWEHHHGQLEARRELGRALFSLDDRNFGIAQGFLTKTAALLQDHGAEAEDLTTVVEKVSRRKVVVAGNLEQQRADMRALVDEFDQVLDHRQAEAPTQTPAPASSANDR